MEKDASVADRLARMKVNYMKEGMRASVEAILLSLINMLCFIPRVWSLSTFLVSFQYIVKCKVHVKDSPLLQPKQKVRDRARKCNKLMLPQIQEFVHRSTDSLSTLASETFTLQSNECDLFDDIKAFIQKSSKKATTMVTTDGNKPRSGIVRNHMKMVFGESRLDKPLRPKKKGAVTSHELRAPRRRRCRNWGDPEKDKGEVSEAEVETIDYLINGVKSNCPQDGFLRLCRDGRIPAAFTTAEVGIGARSNWVEIETRACRNQGDAETNTGLTKLIRILTGSTLLHVDCNTAGLDSTPRLLPAIADQITAPVQPGCQTILSSGHGWRPMRRICVGVSGTPNWSSLTTDRMKSNQKSKLLSIPMSFHRYVTC
ncbi:hypothetical protein ACFE04_002599 [Oxalis oulophora]